MNSLVSILVLYYKSKKCLAPCLNALHRQTYSNLEIFFIDNASGDGAVEYVKKNYPGVTIIANRVNLFFSKALNIAIGKANGRYVLPLNADIIVHPSFVEKMVDAAEMIPGIGMVSGKLLRMDEKLKPLKPAIIDSAGLFFTPEQRHFDRGAEERDKGQFDSFCFIFGPSGAAPLYLREMLDDISMNGEYFDEDFVIYREDADLAWRAQLFGWKSIYSPHAIAYHLRGLKPSDSRRKIPAIFNMHSVKNRFLMRLKNQTVRNGLYFSLYFLWRDILVIGYVLLVEHSSLVGIWLSIKLMPRILKKRKYIMENKRASEDYMAKWFSLREYPPYGGYAKESVK